MFAGRRLLLPAGAFLALTLAVVLRFPPVVRLDETVSAAARASALESPLWRTIMQLVTLTGSSLLLCPLAAIACLLLFRRGHRRAAALVATAMTLTLLVRLTLVFAIGRARPADWLTGAAGWSFPSGHTTASATFALVMVLAFGPLVRRRAALAAGLALWAVAVGASRVVLSVHWPSDVLGAWLLVATVVGATRAALPPARLPAAPHHPAHAR